MSLVGVRAYERVLVGVLQEGVDMENVFWGRL